MHGPWPSQMMLTWHPWHPALELRANPSMLSSVHMSRQAHVLPSAGSLDSFRSTCCRLSVKSAVASCISKVHLLGLSTIAKLTEASSRAAISRS